MLFVCSVAWLFLLGCQYQYKRLTVKTRLRNVFMAILKPTHLFSPSLALDRIYFATYIDCSVISVHKHVPATRDMISYMLLTGQTVMFDWSHGQLQHCSRCGKLQT